MASPGLDAFALRNSVIEEYRRFATSFTKVQAADLREKIDEIYKTDRYWPEPLVQLNPSFAPGRTVDEHVAGGLLHPTCAALFRTAPAPAGSALALHCHQDEAIAKAAEGESYVVTTGTGSGKSLCFFIPIVNAVLHEGKNRRRRTRAIVIYPMNALANSQLGELRKYAANVPGDTPVTFARYTGQESTEERQQIAENPPDILLTNFMMLELLMTRQDELDRRVMANCAGLRFLVLDELHTYRGRQGADVALLVRRVRERLAPEDLICVGTSATMASDGTREDKNRVVARVASKLFATEIPESNVIIETLRRVTEGKLDPKLPQLLGPAVDAKLPPEVSDAALRTNALAIWTETRLGIERTGDGPGYWVRARPRTFTAAVQLLAEESGRSREACEAALRALLLTASIPESERRDDPAGNPRGFFAFKLHQFLSGAGHAFATLEPPSARHVTVEGQQFLPAAPHKRLYSLHFCRGCGHEYHPVRQVKEQGKKLFLARDIDDAPLRPPGDDDATEAELEEAEVFGFLTPHPHDAEQPFEGADEDYPETWVEHDAQGKVLRLKPTYRAARGQDCRVEPDGSVGSGGRYWFFPGKFRFCLRCGETQASASKDRNRLASLSAEGRSSATTVLVASALRWMHGPNSGLERYTRKLLGFTDNRQDAALQAGHFNDFLFVSLTRAAFLGALQAAGEAGLKADDLGLAQQRALGFDRRSAAVRGEWAQSGELRGLAVEDAERTLRDLLAFRAWFDQRRGWRYTNPNLEELGLLTVEYGWLDGLAADDALFADAPPLLAGASAEVRANVYRVLFDFLRQSMAVHSEVLEATSVEKLRNASRNTLRAPWALSDEEKQLRSKFLVIKAPHGRTLARGDEELFVRGGSRSLLGRALRATRTWLGNTEVRSLKAKDVEAITEALLEAAAKHGLVTAAETSFDDLRGYRLRDRAILFRAAAPTDKARRDNPFFRDFYSALAAMLGSSEHPLFGFEAREHTAQVDQERRSLREERFRFGPAEQEKLRSNPRLRELNEPERFLPVLFCSPTMELGVDIAALNAVHLRNVPPTPANYAQRSGRAGRSGQAAVVFTYCSAQSPHDQYFFRDPLAMVHGSVRPPLLDLANRDLVESHLHAVWLACTKAELDPSIAELLELDAPDRPLKAAVRTPMSSALVRADAVAQMKGVLALLGDELAPAQAPWYTGADPFAASVADAALERFERSFGRWRELFRSAEVQRDAARRALDDHASSEREKRSAKGKHDEALAQLSLLRTGTNQNNDFYTYRYLATEGFLPGYNFPRLPLYAYVPTTQDGKGKQTFLQRPRFLALSEFGPRSLVYHEGRAYRVVRAMLSVSTRNAASAEAALPTFFARICSACGGGHFDDETTRCLACDQLLSEPQVVRNIFRIENVATRPAERITANDEERQRQGFELQTTFAWARREQGLLDVRRGTVADETGPILRLAYGPGATITRLNKGLRRRKDKSVFGFRIDPLSGYWLANEDEPADIVDPAAPLPQWIVPCVQDRKNALLVQPDGMPPEEVTLATLQHALLRGVQAVFQLEEGELLAESLPTREERKGFLLYEATEGGAGVLVRLVSEPDKLAEVAREALHVLHFDVRAGLPAAGEALRDEAGEVCVAACYRCLMSYYNQPDHERLDRRDAAAQELLLRLARAKTSLPPSTPAVAVASDSPWSSKLAEAKLPAPDASPLKLEGAPHHLVWRAHYVVAIEPDAPAALTQHLQTMGFAVVPLDDAAIAALVGLLGKSE